MSAERYWAALVIDEEHVWTHEELREARLRPPELIDDPALTLPPIRRVWLNRWLRALPAEGKP
jgi:hypothetical protein